MREETRGSCPACGKRVPLFKLLTASPAYAITCQRCVSRLRKTGMLNRLARLGALILLVAAILIFGLFTWQVAAAFIALTIGIIAIDLQGIRIRLADKDLPDRPA